MLKHELTTYGLRETTAISRFNTPLRYPGGKQRITPFVCELLARNHLDGGHYVEPFAGGAGIGIDLLVSGVVSHIHLNDSWSALYAFWRSVLYKTEELCARICDARLTIDQWRRHREILARPWEFDQLEVGFSLLYLNRSNRSGIIHSAGPIGGLKQNGKWKMNARFPRDELIRRVKAIAAKRSAITLRNWDAERFLREHVTRLPSRTLIYFDPPYFHKSDRLYPNHYAEHDHARIALTIQRSVNRPWVVSYDYTPEIAKLYARRKSFTYPLQYNAAKVYKGTELIIVSDGLRLPAESVLWFMNPGLSAIRPVGRGLRNRF